MVKDALLKKEATTKVDKKARQQERQARKAKQQEKLQAKTPKLTFGHLNNHARGLFNGANASGSGSGLGAIQKEIASEKKKLVKVLSESVSDLEQNYDSYFKDPVNSLFSKISNYLNNIDKRYNITNTVFQTEEDYKQSGGTGVFVRVAILSASGYVICDSSRPDTKNTKLYYANTFENSCYGKNRLVLDITPTVRDAPGFDVAKLNSPPPISFASQPAIIYSLISPNEIGNVVQFSVSQQEPVQTTVHALRNGDFLGGYIFLRLSNLSHENLEPIL
jgi:hypothetical protein